MWTWPNLFTFLRILLLPPFLWQVWQNDFRWALAIFFIASVSDGLDGWLARRLDQHSELGQRLDPLADKLLMVSTFIILTIPGRGYEPLPLWLTVAVIGRDVLILLSALAVQFSTGFNRFRPSYYGKLSTTVQMVTIVIYIVIHAFDWHLNWLLLTAYVATLALTIFSGVHYIFHVRMLLAEHRKEQT